MICWKDSKLVTVKEIRNENNDIRRNSLLKKRICILARQEAKLLVVLENVQSPFSPAILFFSVVEVTGKKIISSKELAYQGNFIGVSYFRQNFVNIFFILYIKHLCSRKCKRKIVLSNT